MFQYPETTLDVIDEGNESGEQDVITTNNIARQNS